MLGAAILGAGAVVYFFNPEHARILSRLRVSPVDRVELSGLRRDAGRCTRCCTDMFALALKDNALFVLSLAALAVRGVWFAAQKIPRPAGRTIFAAEIFVGAARRRRGFHGVAESAGVFISFAVARVSPACDP